MDWKQGKKIEPIRNGKRLLKKLKYAIIVPEQACYKVIASLTSQKKGGGAYEYIPDFNPVIFGR